MGGKKLHEKNGQHEKDEDEMPSHNYRIVKVFIEANFGAVWWGGVTVEILTYTFPWKLSQKDGH